jgi:hypothetical protein
VSKTHICAALHSSAVRHKTCQRFFSSFILKKGTPYSQTDLHGMFQLLSGGSASLFGAVGVGEGDVGTVVHTEPNAHEEAGHQGVVKSLADVFTVPSQTSNDCADGSRYEHAAQYVWHQQESDEKHNCNGCRKSYCCVAHNLQGLHVIKRVQK